MTLIGGGRWVALVEGAPVGGGALYALVKVRDGAVPADGEEIFGDRVAPWWPSSGRGPSGWAPHATPGLSSALRSGGSEITELDPDALGEAASRAGDAVVVARPVPGRDVDGRKLRTAAVALLAAIGVWALADSNPFVLRKERAERRSGQKAQGHGRPGRGEEEGHDREDPRSAHRGREAVDAPPAGRASGPTRCASRCGADDRRMWR